MAGMRVLEKHDGTTELSDHGRRNLNVTAVWTREAATHALDLLLTPTGRQEELLHPVPSGASSQDVFIPIKETISLLDDQLTQGELHPVVRDQRQNAIPR